MWIDPDHQFNRYMFKGQSHQIERADLEPIFHSLAVDTHIHELAYPKVPPPRRPLSSGIHIPDYKLVSPAFHALFGLLSQRHPSELTPLDNRC